MLITRQFSPGERPVRNGLPLAVLALEPDAFPSVIRFWPGVDGLGEYLAADLEVEGALVISLIRHATSPQPGTTVYAFVAPDKMQWALQQVLSAMALKREELLWASPLSK